MNCNTAQLSEDLESTVDKLGKGNVTPAKQKTQKRKGKPRGFLSDTDTESDEGTSKKKPVILKKADKEKHRSSRSETLSQAPNSSSNSTDPKIAANPVSTDVINSNAESSILKESSDSPKAEAPKRLKEVDSNEDISTAKKARRGDKEDESLVCQENLEPGSPIQSCSSQITSGGIGDTSQDSGDKQQTVEMPFASVVSSASDPPTNNKPSASLTLDQTSHAVPNASTEAPTLSPIAHAASTPAPTLSPIAPAVSTPAPTLSSACPAGPNTSTPTHKSCEIVTESDSDGNTTKRKPVTPRRKAAQAAAAATRAEAEKLKTPKRLKEVDSDEETPTAKKAKKGGKEKEDESLVCQETVPLGSPVQSCSGQISSGGNRDKSQDSSDNQQTVDMPFTSVASSASEQPTNNKPSAALKRTQSLQAITESSDSVEGPMTRSHSIPSKSKVNLNNNKISKDIATKLVSIQITSASVINSYSSKVLGPDLIDRQHDSSMPREVEAAPSEAESNEAATIESGTAVPVATERESSAEVVRQPWFEPIKANVPYGQATVYVQNPEEASDCECQAAKPCNEESSCINRRLQVECHPARCKFEDDCGNMRFQKRQYAAVKSFKTSDDRGWGLMSTETIKEGAFVIEYVGEVITMDEFRNRMANKKEAKEENYYFMQINNNRMIDAEAKGNLSRFINNSHDPNLQARKWEVNGDTRIGLFATKEITPGTELTFDYGFENENEVEQDCLCGALMCSGRIGVRKQTKEKNRKVKSSVKHYVKQTKPSNKFNVTPTITRNSLRRKKK